MTRQAVRIAVGFGRRCGWLLALCLAASGCRVVDRLRGPGFDSEPEVVEGRAASSPQGENFSGFSTKARQIEESLGVE